jgi:hypothetical protein
MTEGFIKTVMGRKDVADDLHKLILEAKKVNNCLFGNWLLKASSQVKYKTSSKAKLKWAFDQGLLYPRSKPW